MTSNMNPYLVKIGIGSIFAAVSSILLAAEAHVETALQAAERWGLLSVVAVIIILSVLYMYYQQCRFMQTDYMQLLTKVHRALTRVADGYENCPCGDDGWDSDGEEQEQTPGGTTKAVERVNRRRRRADDREANQ